jgi:site-specific DNA-methyltransferase (adenine-specific)
MITATNEDNMLMMARYPDDYFDLAIVDPPYRNQNENSPTKDMRSNRFVKGQGLGKMPTNKYFIELHRVSKNQIIWGANNFQLPQFKGFVIWKKKTISEVFTMSMCEIASLSDELGTVSKWIEIAPQGTKEDPRIHPTQKPIKLYEWLLMNYAKEGDKIVDTHRGSASLDIACHNLGFDLVTCELDTDYFNDGNKRLKQHQQQLTMF